MYMYICICIGLTRHKRLPKYYYKRPNLKPHPSLNNARRRRGDGAYHLPHPTATHYLFFFSFLLVQEGSDEKKAAELWARTEALVGK